MSVLPSDESGYAIPAADLLCDALNECELLDCEWSDPLDWPDWTDDVVGLGPAFTREASFDDLDLDPAYNAHDLDAPPVFYEPTEQDWADFHAWCRDQDERNQDLEDARRASEYLDMLEGIARFTDEDLMAAGLPVG